MQEGTHTRSNTALSALYGQITKGAYNENVPRNISEKNIEIKIEDFLPTGSRRYCTLKLHLTLGITIYFYTVAHFSFFIYLF